MRGDDNIVPASGAARVSPEISRGFRVHPEIFIRGSVTQFTFPSGTFLDNFKESDEILRVRAKENGNKVLLLHYISQEVRIILTDAILYYFCKWRRIDNPMAVVQ